MHLCTTYMHACMQPVLKPWLTIVVTGMVTIYPKDYQFVHHMLLMFSPPPICCFAKCSICCFAKCSVCCSHNCHVLVLHMCSLISSHMVCSMFPQLSHVPLTCVPLCFAKMFYMNKTQNPSLKLKKEVSSIYRSIRERERTAIV